MVRKPIGNNKLSAFVPPSLPETLHFPPLPPIHDHILRERATTHTSHLQVPKNTHDLDVENYVDINDYEKLEYVGDRILSMCVDLVVHEVYPNMRQGVATMIHSSLVSNRTLAQLADRYGITEKIKTSRDAQHVKNELVKVKGSAFEAWVAGVFFDYQLGGTTSQITEQVTLGSLVSTSQAPTLTLGKDAPARPPDTPRPRAPSPDASSWTRSNSAPPVLPASPTLAGAAPTPKFTTPFTPRSYGEAMDYVFVWLKSLYLPILDFVFTEMRKCQVQILEDEEVKGLEQQKAPTARSPEAEEEHAAGGALLALNVLCEQQYRIRPTWTEERARPGIWRLTCNLTLPDGRRFTKSGEKPTKKVARAMAALEMCRELKVMKKRIPGAEDDIDISSRA